jgi:hypothetical protein
LKGIGKSNNAGQPYNRKPPMNTGKNAHDFYNVLTVFQHNLFKSNLKLNNLSMI